MPGHYAPAKNIYDPPQYSPRNIAKIPYNLFQNRINFRPARHIFLFLKSFAFF